METLSEMQNDCKTIRKLEEKNDVVVKKNDGDGVKRYHTSLSGMPHFDKANAALD